MKYFLHWFVRVEEFYDTSKAFLYDNRHPISSSRIRRFEFRNKLSKSIIIRYAYFKFYQRLEFFDSYFFFLSVGILDYQGYNHTSL